MYWGQDRHLGDFSEMIDRDSKQIVAKYDDGDLERQLSLLG